MANITIKVLAYSHMNIVFERENGCMEEIKLNYYNSDVSDLSQQLIRKLCQGVPNYDSAKDALDACKSKWMS